MRRLINHVRGKSEETRRHILHVTTFCLGLILLSLWVYSLGTKFSNPETEAKIRNEFEPVSSLKANLIGGYQSIAGPSETEE